VLEGIMIKELSDMPAGVIVFEANGRLRGADRDPADPAGDDLLAAAHRVPRLLDLRLPGDRRL